MMALSARTDSSDAPGEQPALQIDDLSVIYQTETGILPAVRSVDLTVAVTETLGLVGESGSGKSTLALGAIGYLPGNGKVIGGSVRLGGTDLLALAGKEIRRIWGSRVGLVSQSPQTALNPSLTVGRQLDEMGRRHLGLGRREARGATLNMLQRVDMPHPASVADRYPHQLSGGMLQRAAIAMALITNPELLILDEPTTALDVTTQALVLDLLEELKAEYSTAILYITHNLGVVARVCDRVAVMYAGEMVEEGAVADLFERPLHPYTINLLNCVPRFVGWSTESGSQGGSGRGPGPSAPGLSAAGPSDAEAASPGAIRCAAAGLEVRLATIPGSLPQPDDLPPGCVFGPRCPLVVEECHTERPALATVSGGHRTSCWRWESLLSEDGRLGAVSLAECAAPAQRPAAGAEGAGGRITSPRPASGAPTLGATTNGAPSPGDGRFLAVSEVTKLYTAPGRKAGTKAVDGVTTYIDPARTLGLVGESGSGKTTLARMVAGLTAPSEGRILMEGAPLAPETGDRSREVLRRLQMVFQNPDASLNPRRTAGQAIIRPLLTLGGLERDAANRRVYELLAAVRLPASYFNRYPAELSGGEKQRVAIARAFAAAPDLVICDEPISSLDVSVQGSLMNLLVDLQAEQGTSYLFISHDVAAVQHLSHRIAVMYLGALMEQGDAALVLAPPYHPYTEALLSAIPVPDPRAPRGAVRLHTGMPIGGEIPRGCRFHPRCPRRLGPLCETEVPPRRSPPEELGDHEICCHIPLEDLLTLQLSPGPEGPRP